jgi:uncharacterized protein
MLNGFEWDESKARSNVRKHGVSFQEAVTVFDDQMSITLDDPEHSDHERRYVTIGFSKRARLLVVCHVDRPDRIRIINSRTADRRERRYYESTEQA